MNIHEGLMSMCTYQAGYGTMIVIQMFVNVIRL